jgi:hypothetical protein
VSNGFNREDPGGRITPFTRDFSHLDLVPRPKDCRRDYAPVSRTNLRCPTTDKCDAQHSIRLQLTVSKWTGQGSDALRAETKLCACEISLAYEASAWSGLQVEPDVSAWFEITMALIGAFWRDRPFDRLLIASYFLHSRCEQLSKLL